MSKTSEMAVKNEQVELASPRDFMSFATELKKLIVDNRLYTDIKGKNYVNVEGWQIAGAFTGTFPVVESVENLSDGDTYRYRAEVSLRDKDGNKVGSGVAVCTNKEAGKTRFDEYAVASMAQTRAVGKAYRLKIGWLLKVAGYETTPAEEMDAVEAEMVEGKKSDIEIAKEKLAKAKDLKELKSIYYAIGSIRDNEEVVKFKDLMKVRFLERGGENE